MTIAAEMVKTWKQYSGMFSVTIWVLKYKEDQKYHGLQFKINFKTAENDFDFIQDGEKTPLGKDIANQCPGKQEDVKPKSQRSDKGQCSSEGEQGSDEDCQVTDYDPPTDRETDISMLEDSFIWSKENEPTFIEEKEAATNQQQWVIICLLKNPVSIVY